MMRQKEHPLLADLGWPWVTETVESPTMGKQGLPTVHWVKMFALYMFPGFLIVYSRRNKSGPTSTMFKSIFSLTFKVRPGCDLLWG